jgi:hypothetical protein
MLLKVHNNVKHFYWENAVHGSDSDENAAIEGASIMHGRESSWVIPLLLVFS